MTKNIAKASVCLIIALCGLWALFDASYCLTPPSLPGVLDETLEKESIAGVKQVLKTLQLRGKEGFLKDLKMALKSIEKYPSVLQYSEKINRSIASAEEMLKQFHTIKQNGKIARQYEAADSMAHVIIEMDWAYYYLDKILVESKIMRLDKTKFEAFYTIKNTLASDIRLLRVALVNNGFIKSAAYSMLDRKNGSIDQAKDIINTADNAVFKKDFQVMFAIGRMFGAKELKNNLQGVLSEKNPQPAYKEEPTEQSFNKLRQIVNARRRKGVLWSTPVDVLRQDINKAVRYVLSIRHAEVFAVRRLMIETRRNLLKIREEKTTESEVAFLMGNIIRSLRDCYDYLHIIRMDESVKDRTDKLPKELLRLNVRIKETVNDFRVALLEAGYPEIAAEAILQENIEDTAQVAQVILSQTNAKEDNALKFITAAALRSVFGFDVEEFKTSSLDITRNVDARDLTVMRSL